MTSLLVLVDRDLAVDAARLRVALDASARDGDEVTVTVVARVDIPRALDEATAQAVLVLPSTTEPLALTPGVGKRAPIVRFDLGTKGVDSSAELLNHAGELGLDGLPFVVASVLAAADSPATRVVYGADPDQYFDWRAGGAHGGTAMLVHGGFYRSRWQAGLMEPLAVDLNARGWATANLEYRRPDRHGWDATIADVHAGVAAAAARRTGPLVPFGHSAGGQLVLQVAEERAAKGIDDIALAVSLAGVVDLVAAHDRFMGEGAISVALDGSPTDRPARYESASPLAFRRRLAPWLLVQGTQDSADLVEMNRRLAASTPLARPPLVEAPGDHFSVIDPASAIWSETVARVGEILSPPRTLGE